MTANNLHQVVIVGGGAGGLELATRLGNRLGRRGRARITLIDSSRTGLWKPLLHEVAAGSLDPHRHALDYIAQARRHHFHFRLGRMDGLDRENKEVWIAPTLDDDGNNLIPRRRLGYDTLIMAVGSTTNDFGTPGVADHAVSLDSPGAAKRFHRRLVDACVRASLQGHPLRAEQLHIVIIGAGATGVELSAELRSTTPELVAYGRENIDPNRDIKLTLLEASDRVLPALPRRISDAARSLLERLNIQVRTGERVLEVTRHGVETTGGRLSAELVVWAAGIKAPAFLADLDGLQCNRINQLVVNSKLQTTEDANIYAIGDCAACAREGGLGNVPPRAQAAHQQAIYMSEAIERRLSGEPMGPYKYRDLGSLVSLGEHTAVGSLTGFLRGDALTIEGTMAQWMYRSLYKKRDLALHGFTKTALDGLARFIDRQTGPAVKLH